MFHREPTAVRARGREEAALRRRGWLGDAYVGMDAQVLDMFAAVLNFTPVVRGTADKKLYGYYKNGTYTGTLSDLVIMTASVTAQPPEIVVLLTAYRHRPAAGHRP